MSTLKVQEIQHPDADTPAITIAVDGTIHIENLDNLDNIPNEEEASKLAAKMAIVLG